MGPSDGVVIDPQTAGAVGRQCQYQPRAGVLGLVGCGQHVLKVRDEAAAEFVDAGDGVLRPVEPVAVSGGIALAAALCR